MRQLVPAPSLLTDEQVPLASAFKAVHLTTAKWFRELLVHSLVANGVPQDRIARETEREPSTITRMLNGEQGFAADVISAILANDPLGIVLTGLCARLGYEPPRRCVPDLAEENRRLREQLAKARAALGEP